MGVNNKLFTAVITTTVLLASVLVTTTRLHPSLIFVSKPGQGHLLDSNLKVSH